MNNNPDTFNSVEGPVPSEAEGGALQADRGDRTQELARTIGRGRGGIRGVLAMVALLSGAGTALEARADGKGGFDKDLRAVNEQLAMEPDPHGKYQFRVLEKDRCILEVVRTEEGSKEGEYTGVWATYVSDRIPLAKIDPGRVVKKGENAARTYFLVDLGCTGSEECIETWRAPASIYDGIYSPGEHKTSNTTSLYIDDKRISDIVQSSLARLVKLCGGKFTPSLMAAVERNDVPAVKKELKKKGSLNERNRGGETPLMIAAKQGNAEIVKLLLSRGADVHQKSNYDFTALYFAVVYNQPKIVEILIAGGANVNQTTGDPLLMSTGNNLEMVKLLLRHGANINAQTEGGWTVLIKSVFILGEPHPEVVQVVQYLIDSGADINLSTKDGQTALDLAKIMHQVASEKGDHAKAYKLAQIIAALQAAGSRPSFQGELNATIDKLGPLLPEGSIPLSPEKRDQAIALARGLLERYPNQAAANGIMAIAYWSALQGDLAIQHYNRACELAAAECPKRDEFLQQVEGMLHRCLTEKGETADAACARAESSTSTLNQRVVGKYLTNSGRLQEWIGRIVSVRGRVFSVTMTYVRDNVLEYRKGKTYDIFFDKARPLQKTSLDATVQGWK